MPEVLILFLAACGTALATGVGAVPVFLLGSRAAALAPTLLGFAAGVMGVAAVAGLLIPASEEGSAVEVLGGLAVGVAFLVFASRRLSPDAGFMGRTGPGARTSALVFLVLFVHSLPEGFAVGTAFASDREGLSLFVILAIAIQNIPEGTSVAIPMASASTPSASTATAMTARATPVVARPARPSACSPIRSLSRPRERMNGSSTSSRTAFSAWVRKRISISGAPGSARSRRRRRPPRRS
jgi:ZIP family zinc transporter